METGVWPLRWGRRKRKEKREKAGGWGPRGVQFLFDSVLHPLTPTGPHSELSATSDIPLAFMNRMSFNQPRQDQLLRRKPVSQLPQAIPTAARMVGREAVPFPAGTLSSGAPSCMKDNNLSRLHRAA
ncbi:C-C chemokine receptor-like 2 isoform X2 [Ursus arctos]|uniref:C-C chemokine receptor-like 2 isoform X2 n=1 Tax=Ursus arctos TaxID=9644 RepID=UPI0025494786|nr:C-C chemokine receptor-like 2 isoform X2 [Ursus arctos]